MKALSPIISAIQDRFNEFIQNILPSLIDIFKTYIEIMEDRFNTVFSFISEELLPQVLKAFEKWGLAVGEIFEGLMEIAEIVFPYIAEAIKIAFEASQVIFEAVWPYCEELIIGVWNTIKDVISSQIKIIQGVINTVLGVLKGDWKQAWEGIKQIGEGSWQQITTIIKAALDLITGAISAWFKLNLNAWKYEWELIKSASGAIWEGIKTVIQTGMTYAKDALFVTVTQLQVEWNNAWNYIYSSVSSIWESIKSVVSSSVNAVSSSVDSFVDGIYSAIDAINIFNSTDPESKNLNLSGSSNSYNPPKFATGIRNFKGGTALVGEEGPELVNLASGSNVYSNSELKNLLSSTGKTIQNTFEIGNLIVRKDTDIKEIARELYMLQLQQNRGMGVVTG